MPNHFTTDWQAMLILLVQEIKVKWTKHSRGAPHAARRNAVPSILPVPTIKISPTDSKHPCIIHHQAVFEERDDFAPKETVTLKSVEPPNRRIKLGCLRPHFLPECAEINFNYSYYCGGAPDRSAPSQTVLTLEPNEWGQILYNGRFSRGYSGGWFYQHFVFNIALMKALPSDMAAIFTVSGLVKVYKNLADLR